jgi:hypothetical protein
VDDHLELYAYADTDSHADADANTNADSHADADPNADADSDSDSDANSDADARFREARIGRLLAQLHQPGGSDVPVGAGEQ